MQRHTGVLSRRFVWGSHHEAGAHTRVMRGNPGAGVDQQVAADWAGVCDLALADRGAAHAGPRLAQLVDLVHDAAQVAGPVLMQTGRHGQRDGGGRYSYVRRGVCIGELSGSVCARRRLLLKAVGHGRRSCTHSLGMGLRAHQALGVLQVQKRSPIRHVSQILSHALLGE